MPALPRNIPALQVSLAIALAALLAVELVRCCQVPVLAPAIHHFMKDFTDERDAGPVYVTHIALLLGMAMPVWLVGLLPAAGAGGVAVAQWQRQVLAVSGLVCLGVGDSVASAVGYCYGRIKLHRWTKKTVEGTVAGILSMYLSMLFVVWCSGAHGAATLSSGAMPWSHALGLGVASFLAGSLEALTHQLDNLVVPVFYCTHILIWFL